MNDWTPGDGWTETDRVEWKSVVDGLRLDSADGPRFWVRESPVPALPTVPGTVIDVMSTTRPEIDVTPWFLTPNNQWVGVGNYAASIEGGLQFADVTSFRIISETRAVTAKAVLDRIGDHGFGVPGANGVYDKIARAFGVES